MNENVAQMKSLDRQTLADAARSELERQILEGGLSPGEKLNEVALSNVLGVSRGTVREAIRTLSQSGLIELIANRGAYVREVSAHDVVRLYELRRVVFGLGCENAARRVAEGAAGDVVERLLANIDEMRAIEARGDAAGYYPLNIQFHDTLMSAADNPYAKAAYDECVRKMHLFRRRGLSKTSNVSRSIEEHAAIVEAISKGDAERAAEHGRSHVKKGLERFIATLTEAEARAFSKIDATNAAENEAAQEGASQKTG